MSQMTKDASIYQLAAKLAGELAFNGFLDLNDGDVDCRGEEMACAIKVLADTLSHALPETLRQLDEIEYDTRLREGKSVIASPEFVTLPGWDKDSDVTDS